MKNISALSCYGDPDREAGVLGVALVSVSKSGLVLCSLANVKDLNYLASVGAVLGAVFCEITSPGWWKKYCRWKCGRWWGWLVRRGDVVGTQH